MEYDPDVVRDAVKLYRKGSDPLYKSVALGIFLSLVVFIASSLAGAALHAPNYVSFLGLLLGLLYMIKQLQIGELKQKDERK